jgi:molybdopterin-biosynthesis enzyme MoeA-like protein
MDIGLYIIGDEIISGKRQDKHLAKVIELLAARGLQLTWAQYIGDSRQHLVSAFQRSMASGDLVFSCGGIGATPDDHTRQAAAAAAGLELCLHPEAARLITERVQEQAAQGQAKADMALPENQQRLKMGEFPTGARIIPNPYNRIPGFNLAHHWFVPGFPVMAWPMIEATLDSHYSHLFHRQPRAEKSFLVAELAESTATPLMEDIEARFSQVKVFSLPSMGEAGMRRHIELGVKGPPDRIEEAFEALRRGALALGGQPL